MTVPRSSAVVIAAAAGRKEETLSAARFGLPVNTLAFVFATFPAPGYSLY